MKDTVKKDKSMYQHTSCRVKDDMYAPMRKEAIADASNRVSARVVRPLSWSENQWREYLIHYGVCLENIRVQTLLAAK